jgi:Protein of unknown function (DUF1838)
MSDSSSGIRVPPAIDRRAFLQGAGGVAAGTFAASKLGLAAAAAEVPMFESKIDFRNPVWNRDTYARLQGNLDLGKEKIGWYNGVVIGVTPGEAARPLVRFDGFSVCRLIAIPDGFRKLLREVVFYRDLRSGQLLEQWTNPWTGEVVPVVNVANDPFNYNITLYYPEPPSFGGKNEAKPPRIPFLLPWRDMGDKLLLTTDIHLFYPNALQPDKWPRESSGPMVQASEMFRYVIDRKAVEDPTRTSVTYNGTWNRITPWLPWMLLGTKPGHCLYVGDMGASDSLDVVPKDILAYCEKNLPKFLSAPTEDYGPSLSSIENFARQQRPAPVK